MACDRALIESEQIPARRAACAGHLEPWAVWVSRIRERSSIVCMTGFIMDTHRMRWQRVSKERCIEVCRDAPSQVMPAGRPRVRACLLEIVIIVMAGDLYCWCCW